MDIKEIKSLKDYGELARGKNYVAIEISKDGKRIMKILEFTGEILPQVFKVACDAIQQENELALVKTELL